MNFVFQVHISVTIYQQHVQLKQNSEAFDTMLKGFPGDVPMLLDINISTNQFLF